MCTAITANNPLFRNPRSDVCCKDWLQGTPFCWHALLGLNSPGSRSATVDQRHLEPYSSTFPYHISNLSPVLPRSLTPVGQSKVMAVPKGHSDYTHISILNKCCKLLSAENAVSTHVTRIVPCLVVIKAESIRKECEGTQQVSPSASFGGSGLPTTPRQPTPASVFKQGNLEQNTSAAQHQAAGKPWFSVS